MINKLYSLPKLLKEKNEINRNCKIIEKNINSIHSSILSKLCLFHIIPTTEIKNNRIVKFKQLIKGI